MKGKIFSSSQDLYQDQAKILFDFYKDAAERIVSQEEELEKEMEVLKNSIAQHAEGKKKAMTQMYVGIGIFVVGLILIAVMGILGIAIVAGGLYWGIKSYTSSKSSTKSIESVGKNLKELEDKHRRIFRDYKIESKCFHLIAAEYVFLRCGDKHNQGVRIVCTQGFCRRYAV